MPVNPITDLIIKGSSPLATSGNSLVNGGPGTNLGGFCTAGAIADATLDNLFVDVTGVENAQGNNDYQCYFLHNNHATLGLSQGYLYVASDVAGGTVDAVGLDPIGPTLVGTGVQQAQIIANKNTPPVGVVFTTVTTPVQGLVIGNLLSGYTIGIWVRRTSTNSPGINNDNVQIGTQFVSPP